MLSTKWCPFRSGLNVSKKYTHNAPLVNLTKDHKWLVLFFLWQYSFIKCHEKGHVIPALVRIFMLIIHRDMAKHTCEWGVSYSDSTMHAKHVKGMFNQPYLNTGPSSSFHLTYWGRDKMSTSLHRENSPITQTTPEPTLLTWGGWPFEKYSPHPWPRSQTRSYCTDQATQTPLFSNPLMLPFDTQVCHERQICLRFHQLLKVILEMAFSAHCTSIWKLNQISRTSTSKVV